MRPGQEAFTQVIFHVEVEAEDRLTGLRPRVCEYNRDLQRTYELPVISLGLYLRVALDGRGFDAYEETIFEDTGLRFQWRYLGLPGLEAEEHVAGDNWLGVALSALMQMAPGRRAWVAAEAMRRLLEAPLKREDKAYLCECVQAYLPLTPDQRVAFNQLLQREAWFKVG